MRIKLRVALSKIVLMCCTSVLAVFAVSCADNTDMVKADTEDVITEIHTEENMTDENKADEIQGHKDLSWDTFYDTASRYDSLSDEDIKVMYQRITDSKILEKENMRLTGVALNDYDANGMTDVLVCLYEDKDGANTYQDGCLYLFMNDDEPYYIYDDFCCYSFGWIFGDFGADIDNDGYTEIVFCVQGTGCGGAGDCQKFVLKYKDNKIERMELPNDFDYDYDCGLTVEIEKDTEKGLYSAYCPYLDDTIVFDTEQNEDDWGGENSRGYYLPAIVETDTRAFFTMREYLCAGCVANWVGDAVFVLDWDENGKAYVRDWYIEAWDNKIYTPLQKTSAHQ